MVAMLPACHRAHRVASRPSPIKSTMIPENNARPVLACKDCTFLSS